MKYIVLALFLANLWLPKALAQNTTSAALWQSLPKPVPAKQKIQILFLGCAHLGQEQFYKAGPGADVFSEKRQAEIAAITQQLAAFAPDLVLIETEPQEQAQTDSLYGLYKASRLQLTDLPYGRAEKYQFGFRLARLLGHAGVSGADCYESVSNRMLAAGTNLAAFQSTLDSFSAAGTAATTQLAAGRLSLRDYLLFLNAPPVLDWTYQTLLVNPLRVQQGEFKNPPPAYVDTAYVNKQYIGAEFASVFYERELKIYSNIVAAQLRQKSRRMLVVMGQRHAALLTKMFACDPAYKVVPLQAYIR